MLFIQFRSFFFWLWVNHFCLICVHLLLVYHSAQLSHTWSDFSRSLRVMISETRVLFHFIIVLLSSTLMNQLTCNVGIISVIRIFVLDIYLVWLVPGHRNCRYLCSLHNFFSFHNLRASQALFYLLRLVYCIVIITLCRLPCSLPYLFFTQFDSSVCIRIQFGFH